MPRAKSEEPSHYDINTEKLVCDDFLRKLKQKHINVIKYPNITHLLSIAKANTTMNILADDAEIDGGNVSKVRSLGIRHGVTIRNMPKLQTVSTGGYITHLTIENCKLLQYVDVDRVGKITIKGKRKTRICFNEIDELDVHENVYLLVTPGTVLTKRYDTLYELHVCVNTQEDLDKHHPESLNINILKIIGQYSNNTFDLSKFKLDEVTTMVSNCTETIFADDGLKKVISWSSYPRINHPVPQLPRVKFMFIKGLGKDEEIQAVYDKAYLYEGALAGKNSLRFEMRYCSQTKYEFDQQKLLDNAIAQREEIDKINFKALKNPTNV